MGAFDPPKRDSDEMLPTPLFWTLAFLLPISTIYHLLRVRKIKHPPKPDPSTTTSPEITDQSPLIADVGSSQSPPIPRKRMLPTTHTYRITPRNIFLRIVKTVFVYWIFAALSAQTGVNIFWYSFWYIEACFTALKNEHDGWKKVWEVLMLVLIVIWDLFMGFVWFVVWAVHMDIAFEAMWGIFMGPVDEEDIEWNDLDGKGKGEREQNEEV
jgi:hypothetical protein